MVGCRRIRGKCRQILGFGTLGHGEMGINGAAMQHEMSIFDFSHFLPLLASGTFYFLFYQIGRRLSLSLSSLYYVVRRDTHLSVFSFCAALLMSGKLSLLTVT